MIDLKHCDGCHDNFYNAGNNALGVCGCWSRQDATLVTRYRISIDAPMGERANYEEATVPDCRHEDGFVLMVAIPHYAK